MVELYISIHSLEKYKIGEETFAYSSRNHLLGNLHPVVKILLPFEAVEHIGDGEFRLLIKGLEY